ncbi:MAG: succinate--CoA ligase subunit alpha [Syntrophobacterales bacterium]|nr:succinate--CoA ligase subunit alpha [Syntrophobacterales bacterium]
MSILLNKNTRVLVQGITGKIGTAQTHWMLAYGTNIVAGATPGKGGNTVEGIPVFDSVREARERTGAEASVFFVPAPFVLDAFVETVDAGINLIVVVPEHVPVHDAMRMKAYARRHESRGLFALGPTTPGILTAGEAKMGIMPASLFNPGSIGIISRSGTLSYEMAGILSHAGFGQSTVVGMGADPVALASLSMILEQFENDPATRGVVVVGEVGGAQEEEAAQFILEKMKKPVAAYIAGRFAPEGKRMGHAGAIIRGSQGTFASKIQAFQDAHATILKSPIEVVEWAQNVG